MHNLERAFIGVFFGALLLLDRYLPLRMHGSCLKAARIDQQVRFKLNRCLPWCAPCHTHKLTLTMLEL